MATDTKTHRNIRITTALAERMLRINEVLDRPSLNNLGELMIAEYCEMIEQPLARLTPKLAVDYDARMRHRSPLGSVSLYQAQSSDLPIAAEESPEYPAQRRSPNAA